jgi:Fe(3+) dicitrate transport protein
MQRFGLLISTLFCVVGLGAQTAGLTGRVTAAGSREPLTAVSVYLDEGRFFVSTDADGRFALPEVPAGDYELHAELLGYESLRRRVTLRAGAQKELELVLSPVSYLLTDVTVADREEAGVGQRTLRNVEGMAIYAGRKSELILPDELTANLATNNAREIFKGVAGLNVWENDAAGLQLAIGARGLNPNRTANFNTRQNGFDISADALGYPESYYTPPAQALARIELVRGAASLQYGTQFGGLLNFKLKEGPEDKAFELLTENTVGSFGLFNSFTSVGGTKGKVNYYGFYQYKRGDGWRPNAGFDQHTAYADVHWQVTRRLRLGVELTRMNYLAQQPGGLQDFEFRQNPRQSKRARNWFRVDWNLAALHLDYDFSDRTKLNVRNFFLLAQRDALGELGPINRPDPLRERDLIIGRYRNFGSEARLLHRYELAGRPTTFLAGLRYYQGYTHNRQGDASAGSDPDFRFLNPGALERSEYEFPSRNVAFFAEHLFNLGERWTLTPGLRLEYIRTAADGYYRQRVFSGGEVIFDRQVPDADENERQFALLGLGLGFRPAESTELYANISQNYRAINFSDLVVVNPNLVIDSLLRDESGYNAELGIRGQAARGALRFDANVFYLRYNDRIGLREITVPDPIVIERLTTLRTNIGDAALYGFEAFAEAEVVRWIQGRPGRLDLRPFVNLSLLRGTYRSGHPSVVGKQVELVPPLTVKTGVAASYGNLRGQFLYTYVYEQYSDATNAEFVVDATRGIIPSYQVLDASVSYRYRNYRLQAGVNNLADARYFTRRATGYPGPGIIPAEARSWYLGLQIVI